MITYLRSSLEIFNGIKNFRWTKSLMIFLLFLLSFPSTMFGEGSKEIWVLNYKTALFMCNDFLGQCDNGAGARLQFAVYNCDSLDRLYFVTDSSVERVYLGFQGHVSNNYKIVYRIKDMYGNIVKDETDLPTDGTGYINDIGEARVGPEQLYGANGYPAISYYPPSPGTYYIEFNRIRVTPGNNNTGTFRVDLLDITVADTVAMVAHPGRVFSYAWQFDSYPGDGMNNCSATFYVYSTDSITTSLALDDMNGGVWFIYCNQTGAGNTGDWVIDRQSTPSSSYAPQYRVFINPPDTNLFQPASTLGNIVGTPWAQAYCDDGHMDFHVTVDKPGNVDITLTFDPPYVSRTVSAIVEAGANTLIWDGTDGNGTPVPNNVNIDFTVSYINGLTNLPLYDVESNNNGFTIDIVSPAGATPLVFWDDTQVGGGSNFTGCSGDGCHPWSDGNLNTMNTWWYNVSSTTAPVTIYEQRKPDTLVFNQSPPQNYCSGTYGVSFSVNLDPSTERYYWSYTGTGATIHQVDTADNFITVDFASNATPGDIQVYGTNNNCSDPGPVSSLAIAITSNPDAVIAIAPNDTVCVNSNTTFSGTDNAGTNVTSWEWNFADGQIGTGQTANHIYTVTLTDSVRLIATNDNGCVDTAYRDISVKDPSVNFTMAPNPACLFDTIYFNGTGDTVTYTDWSWDFGDGNTDTGHDVSHLYSTPDTFNVVLTVCSKTVNQQLIVHPEAVADAGSNETLCESHPFDFSTSATLPTASHYDSLRWIGGTGSFSNPTLLLPVYTPGTGEVGPIPLSLIAYGQLPCGNDTSTMILSLDSLPVPGYYKIPDDSICVSELVSFTDTSTTNITVWQWNFGDGNGSAQQNPTHAYTTDGLYNVQLIVTNNHGCTDSITNPLQVHPLPQPDFGIAPNDTICAELPLSFSGVDNAGTNITNWMWNFGDGQTATGQNAVHTYTAAGDYIITLDVLNNNSCTETVSKTVHVNALPQADFAITPNDTSCMGEVVNFDGTPITTDIINWQWQFGDGNGAGGQDTSHVYNQAGNYNVLSIYSNANGCLDTTIHQRVVQDVNVGFNIVPNPTCQNYLVNFTGTGNLVTFTPWNWDFGDGSATATGHNVSHIYNQEDTVNITLNVCSQQVTHSLDVKGTCHVDAGSDEATCQDVYFDLSTSSTPPSGDHYDSIHWYGGMGTFDDPTLLAPTYTPNALEGAVQIDTIVLTMVGYGLTPCENDTSTMQLLVVPGAYAQAGTDENSCFDEAYDFHNSALVPFATNYATLYWTTSGTGYFVNPNVEVPVYIPGTGELGPITMTLVAANIINCDSIDEMVLTIRPTYEVPVNITVCHYDSVFAQGQWRYISGTYYDTLHSVYNCDSVIVTNLTVRPKIDKDFTISSGDSVCRNELVDFTQSGSASLSSWLWDFGDGFTSSDANPQHAYDTTGIFNVIFSYTDNNGCSDSAVKQIHVFPLPDAGISMTMSNTCVNTQVDFSGYSNANIVSWLWDFGDGQSGTGQNISHVYTAWGDMTITLTVTDAAGCSIIATQFLNIAQPPIADFTDQVLVCDTIQFTDMSSSAPGYNLVLWHWEFGDGDTSNLQNPLHAYAQGGTYTVTLQVTADSLGFQCTDTVAKSVSVPNQPDIFYTWNPDPTCFGDTTYFHGTSGFPITTWHWDFTDGYFATDSLATHVFADTGLYNVLLTITDTNGCINALSHSVRVKPLPDLTMTVSDSILCSGGAVFCSGSSSDSITDWYWDFGDGSFSIEQNPTHYYIGGGTYTISLTATDTTGCSSTQSKSLLVSPSPTADYTYNIISCTQVSFSDMSTAPAGYQLIGWNWDFDDGTTSTLQNPLHDFPAIGGLYNVQLIVTSDSSGYSCYDTITQGVMVPTQPSVFFTWDPEPTMLGNSTNFYGTSGNTISSWYWDFGDGTFSTNQNPTHIYPVVGTFSVTLTVTDDAGCTNAITHSVTVVNIPGLDFYWGSTCMNSPVQFYINDTATDINAVVSWNWDFGDGGSSSEMEPQHTYLTEGSYNVSLTIVDTMNATNTVTKVLTVHPLPIANFGVEQPVCEGNASQFHDYSSTASGYITQWSWDFGDGSDTTVLFPDNPDVSHTYASAGTYTVTLSVLNSDSCTNFTTSDITIQPSPIALFTHSDGTCFSQPVTFTDQSLENGGGTIISWLWDFGDPASGSANSSTLQNPSHLFSASGDYDVLLTIANASGCSDTSQMSITIGDNPAVDFTYTLACLGAETQFTVDTTVTNVSEVATYAWDFGDGGTSNLPNPTHIYDNQGDYTATLTITTIAGCYATMQHTVHINPLPTANFVSTAPVCDGDTVFFTNLSSSPNGIITQWEWDFGDGNDTIITYPGDPNVSHLYTNTAIFAVVLTVTDTTGCQSSVTRQIEVVPHPVADFSYAETCYGDPVYYTDLSTPNGGPDLQSWDWYFGDPQSGVDNHSTLQNPTHVYTEPGTYTTTLIISNTLGCSDTTEQDITVDSLPSVGIVIADDSLCLGEPAVFTGIGTDINAWYWDFGDGGSSIEQNPSYTYGAPGTYVVTLTVTGIDGCENSATDTVYVNDAPVAGFTFANTCLTDSTYFTDGSSSPNGYLTNWAWDFGDGGSSTEQNPSHLYAARDNYQVTLIVTDNFGCGDTLTQWVQVYGRPQSGFTYSQVCDPEGQVYFSDQSQPGADGSPIQSWRWNLYDGYYSTEINPGYIYPQTDTCYTVSLEVTDGNGCSASDTVQVCLFGTLTTDFTATEECQGQTTFFQSSYTPQNDSVASYTWDYHDGTPQEVTYHDTISHLFPAAGTYLVELIAQDTNGCSYHAFNEVIVDSLPTPRFTYEAGLCDGPTRFTDQSLGGGAFIQSWQWDFGDIASGGANTSTEQNPVHYYGPLDSTYQVKLIITNFNGCTDSLVQFVTIQPCLVADFALPTGENCARQEACFTDLSQVASNNGSINQWQWDFGDGNTYTHNTPENPICHTYSDADTYTVQLIISATIGSNTYTDTVVKQLTIRPTPVSQLTVSNNCYGDTTRFFDNSLTNGSPITYWRWDFDTTVFTGDTSILQNPVYSYTHYGTYTPQLIVRNQYGCTDTTTGAVTIYKLPVADFDFEATCMSYNTYFTDATQSDSSAIGSWHWEFDTTTLLPPYNNNDTSNQQNPVYIYDTSGHYIVSLITVDGHQCRDTAYKAIEIYPIPTAAFNLTDRYDGKQGQVYLENLSKNANSYFWDFDNGITTAEASPVYQYTEDGQYDIMLIAYNSYNCPDTTIQTYDLLFTKLYVPNAFTPGDDNPAINTFKPVGTNLRRYTLEIYSSWGNLLFKSSKIADGHPAEGWDGTYNNQAMPTGSYIWHITAEFKDGTFWKGSDNGDGNINTSGTLTLIR